MAATRDKLEKRDAFERPARVAQCREEGFQATIVQRGKIREFHLTILPKENETLECVLRLLHGFTMAQGAKQVKWEVFGPVKLHAEFTRIAAEVFGEVQWPVTWAEGAPCGDEQICGMHVLAVGDAECETIWEKGRAVGVVFSDGFARHCVLGNVITSPKLSRPLQGKEVFHLMSDLLKKADMTLTDVARTWLYLDRILDWYGPFNTARREIFEEYDVFKHLVPASTGIGARNEFGGAVTAGAWALQAVDPRVKVRQVMSPLQCPAPEYGSCFSRAVEIESPDQRRLFVSGTASIAPSGVTEHVGDIEKQVALTMEVVEAILRSRGYRWNNTTRATAYFKKKEFVPAFRKYLKKHSLPLATLLTEADVCRDDLLFEIEIDAMLPRRVMRAEPQRPLYEI